MLLVHQGYLSHCWDMLWDMLRSGNLYGVNKEENMLKQSAPGGV